MGTPEEATGLGRDPHKEGLAPWSQKSRRLAREWANGLGMTFVDIDLSLTIEYPLLERLNRIYVEFMGNSEAWKNTDA